MVQGICVQEAFPDNGIRIKEAYLTYSCFIGYNILFLKKKYVYINIQLTHSDAYLIRFT